jgi:riboflavin kinase / FMN adenylyltransferase
MIVINGLNDLPVFKNPVLTIGTFDGVHFGHRKIINRLINRAKEVNGESILITFEPHPRLVLGGQFVKLSLLTTLQEKLDLLMDLPLDYLVIVPFTKHFSEQLATEYIQHFLIDHFHPHTIIIGHDHHFGKSRSGNFALLNSMKEELNFNLEEISVQEIEHIAVSSTKVREALRVGNMQMAKEYLCRNYALIGRVIHGDKRGSTIGYPTANIEVDDENKLIPANGVYAVNVRILERNYEGMMNIGFRPTVHNDEQLSMEVHLFNFNESIYNEIIQVEFVHRIRDEIKFNSVDELTDQLGLDEEMAKEILNAI